MPSYEPQNEDAAPRWGPSTSAKKSRGRDATYVSYSGNTGRSKAKSENTVTGSSWPVDRSRERRSPAGGSGGDLVQGRQERPPVTLESNEDVPVDIGPEGIG